LLQPSGPATLTEEAEQVRKVAQARLRHRLRNITTPSARRQTVESR
jgi:hypothetical protein